MNAREPYERRWEKVPPEVVPSSDRPVEPSALAVHGDPTHPNRLPANGPKAPGLQIAWVRPSELSTVLLTPAVGRGINLQAELTRRARRSPITASRASRRITRTAIARTERVTPTEGLQL